MTRQAILMLATLAAFCGGPSALHAAKDKVIRRDARQSPAKSYDLASPNGKIKTIVAFDDTAGKLSLRVMSGEAPIFMESPLGILTDKAKFTDGMKIVNTAEAKIDETHTLPQGKASTYHNRANELTLALEKDGQKLNVIFRAYDDGIAFRYAIPGNGDIRTESDSQNAEQEQEHE